MPCISDQDMNSMLAEESRVSNVILLSFANVLHPQTHKEL